jgi:transcriptional regulator with XRE-family HTH domain
MKPAAFAALIAGLQTEGQMSRTAIAEATGLSRSTIWRIANGEARRPSHEAVEKVTSLHERKLVSHMKQKKA